MFRDKNILIIMPFYYEYHKQIKKHLEQRGAKVFLINDNVNEFSFFHRIISIYASSIFSYYLRFYYKKMFARLPNYIDSILIIKGSTISNCEICYLKKKYKNVKIIMYQWDSIAHYSKACSVALWCDYKITFDPKDAHNNNWEYRALFFDPDFCDTNISKSVDVSYICSVHSNRVCLYHKIVLYAKKYKLKLFDYVYSNKWSYYRQRYLKRNNSFSINSSLLKFVPLAFEETAKIYDKSKVVLDFKFTNQIGLTIRTIESIGHNCKLITNNKQIIYEDFYNPENIYIYDINNFDIPISFFQTPYVPVSKEIYYKYTIDGWLDDIFKQVFC